MLPYFGNIFISILDLSRSLNIYDVLKLFNFV